MQIMYPPISLFAFNANFMWYLFFINFLQNHSVCIQHDEIKVKKGWDFLVEGFELQRFVELVEK
jgi:hypothetical protein